MRFFNFCDFYNRKKSIRNAYRELVINDMFVYKYYIYSRRFMREKACDVIWEYLNSAEPDEISICMDNLDKELAKYRYKK